MRIYIPSRGRAGNINTQECTATLLREGTYVVPPGDVGRYERALSARPGTFEVVGCPEEGIAATRHWIGREAARRGEEAFIMMDDDLLFCVRRAADSVSLRKSTVYDVQAMVEWTRKQLREYAHVSISTRQGNNNLGPGSEGDLVKTNSRTLRYLAYQTSAFLTCTHGRVPVMEDFDVNLQLLERGLDNIQSFWWAHDQRATGSAGGCSIYRTEVLHDEAARRLVSLHPDFVRLRKKVNKTGHLRERTEVTIFWQKAIEEGRRVNGAA